MSLCFFKYGTTWDIMQLKWMILQKKMYHCSTMGFYLCNMLAMGLILATDIFQDRMNALLLGNLDYVIVFLDILIIGKVSFDDHLEKVLTVL